MNIAFLILPKEDVVYLPLNSTMRQVMERMEHHRYTAVPIIDEHGKYVGTITEGDLLWKLKNTPGLTFEGTEKVRLQDIPRRMATTPVRIRAEVEELLPLAIGQNFVPVIDDEEVFVGIVRRRELIQYCAKLLLGRQKAPVG